MSTTSDLRDLLRRRSVGSNAEVTVGATMASMAIRAALEQGNLKLGVGAFRAVSGILSSLEVLRKLRDGGELGDLTSRDKVARESLEFVQVMARAASQEQTVDEMRESASAFLNTLIDSIESVSLDEDTRVLVVSQPDQARQLAEALDDLGTGTLSVAVLEDRLRTSAFAVA